MQNIKVSIIVPVYNVADYLRSCLDSCVNQTLQEIEVIVVNDCSPDPRDSEIMREYEKNFPNKVKCIWHKENKRLGGTRNTGIHAACGEFIYCVDSDDYIDLKLCEKMYNAIIEEKADMAVCNFNRIIKDVVIKNWSYAGTTNNGEFKSSDLCDRMKDLKMHNACIIMIKKSVIEDNNLYFSNHNGFEDSICVLWYLASKKIVRINEALYYYIAQENSITQEKKIENYNLSIQTVKYILSSDYFSSLDIPVKKSVFIYLFNFIIGHCYIVCTKYPAEFVNFCNNVLDILKIYKVSYDDIIYTQSEENIRVKNILCFIESNVGLPNFNLEFIAYYTKKLRNWISSYKDKRFTIWGCGYWGKQSAENMNIMGIEFEITDTNAKLHGKSIANVVVKPWDELKEHTDVVLVSAMGIFDEINAKLSKECPGIEVVDFIKMLED
jgi:glycosyltransferase involved in cell wall biosynthesis